MAYSLIVNTSKTGATTTDAIDTTGANLIVIFLADDNATPAPSDSKGNTWTGLTGSTVGFTGGRFYYAVNPTVGTGHTFTQDQSYEAIFVQAWSGASASPVDQQNGATGSPVSQLQAGSITPSEDNELVVMATANGGTAAVFTIDGGFTISDQISAVDEVSYGGAMAYLVQTSAAAANPTMDWTGSDETVARIVSFKVPSVSGTKTLAALGVG